MNTPPPSLKSATVQAVSQSLHSPSLHKSPSTKVSLQPWVPGYPHLLHYGDMAPVMLQLEGRKEVFLWDVQRTELLAEYQFALRLLGDLQLALPKTQLLQAAEQLAHNIRDQVQLYREVLPAQSSGQGLLKEHLVTLEVRGERIHWDLGCEQNSPELYAKVLCDDLKLHPEESVHIAFEIRTQIREHLRRLVTTLNAKLRRLSTSVPPLSDPPTLSGLEDNLLEILPLPLKRHKNDEHRRLHKRHKPSRTEAGPEG